MPQHQDQYKYKGWRVTFEGDEQERLWDDAYTVEYVGGRIHHHRGVGTRRFESRKEALDSALRKAQNWIDMVGTAVIEMGCDAVVDIRSPEAHKFPFRFTLGDRVRSRLAGRDEGIIATGVYYGASSSGSYRIFYEGQRDDGMYFRSDENDLEPTT
ncbi:hypothetical protein MYX65_01195 [Acidobacteria bacterium AH-259-L09]|nr:hypothetical protein [Acidobacteria bacterium AH-259-L09]